VPSNWRPYESQTDAVWRAAKPASALVARYPQVAVAVAKLAGATGKTPAELRFLPLVSRQVSGVVLLAPPDPRPAGYLPVDGFL
jgi:hypothetical protein